MIDWYVEPDHSSRVEVDHSRHVEPDHSIADIHWRGSSRIRRNEERANSLALIITTSLLFVLIASALMVGGHAAIAPLLSRETPGGAANSSGDIVYAMPDGVFCRHMSFDNATGAISEAGVERCAQGYDRADASDSKQFKWGAH